MRQDTYKGNRKMAEENQVRIDVSKSLEQTLAMLMEKIDLDDLSDDQKKSLADVTALQTSVAEINAKEQRIAARTAAQTTLRNNVQSFIGTLDMEIPSSVTHISMNYEFKGATHADPNSPALNTGAGFDCVGFVPSLESSIPYVGTEMRKIAIAVSEMDDKSPVRRGIIKMLNAVNDTTDRLAEIAGAVATDEYRDNFLTQRFKAAPPSFMKDIDAAALHITSGKVEIEYTYIPKDAPVLPDTALDESAHQYAWQIKRADFATTTTKKSSGTKGNGSKVSDWIPESYKHCTSQSQYVIERWGEDSKLQELIAKHTHNGELKINAINWGQKILSYEKDLDLADRAYTEHISAQKIEELRK